MRKTTHTSKLTMIMLCLILCLSLLASCGGGEDPTAAPSKAPATEAPTQTPTEAPTAAPTEAPTTAETAAPTVAETEATEAPTVAETEAPTVAPTDAPTEAPTVAPTEAPTAQPTDEKPTDGKVENNENALFYDYSGLNFEEYITLDLSIIEGMTVEVDYAAEITDEDIDAVILEILAESEATEITKEIAEYYMETTLAADADPEAALREYLAVEMEEERMSYVRSEVSYQVGEALLGSVAYKKLPEEAVAFQMNSMREGLKNQYESMKEHDPEYAAMTFEEFLVDYFDVEDVENFDLDAVLLPMAEESVKEELVFYYLVDQKDFSVTDEEIAQMVKAMCEEAAELQNMMDPEANATAESVYAEAVANYGAGYLEAFCEYMALGEKIDEYCYKACVIVYGGISEEGPENQDPEEEEMVDLSEYENPILFHTPKLDGVIDEEYYKSYHFDNGQFTHTIASLKDEDGNPIYDAYTNRSTTYILWDEDYIYVAVERWDDDLIARTKAYTEAANPSNGDINPWYNDAVEVWFVFDMTYPTKDKDMKKISYDCCGVGDGPYSAIAEGVYSNWFLECAVASTHEFNANPDDEQGYCDRTVLEFKIPAKTESGDPLYEEDFIFIAIQSDDLEVATDEEIIAKGFDPDNLDETASSLASGYKTTWTRARTVFPTEDGENGGFGKGYLTMIKPSQVADPE